MNITICSAAIVILLSSVFMMFLKDDKLLNLEGINNNILAELAKSKILTIDDFADLASFELIDKEEGILKDLYIEEEDINKMIMKARENWFTENK